MQGQREEGTVAVRVIIVHVIVLVAEMLAVLLVVFAVMRCCQKSYHFCYQIFGAVTVDEPPGVDRTFEVKKDDTMYQVAKRLSQEGLIASPYSFYARTFLMDEGQVRLRSGVYVLNTSMDYEQIIDRLTTSE